MERQISSVIPSPMISFQLSPRSDEGNGIHRDAKSPSKSLPGKVCNGSLNDSRPKGSTACKFRVAQ